MSKLYVRVERTEPQPRPTPIDRVMQFAWRGADVSRVRRDRLFDEYIVLVIGNIAIAFNGDRLVLARAR